MERDTKFYSVVLAESVVRRQDNFISLSIVDSSMTYFSSLKFIVIKHYV